MRRFCGSGNDEQDRQKARGGGVRLDTAAPPLAALYGENRFVADETLRNDYWEIQCQVVNVGVRSTVLLCAICALYVDIQMGLSL